MGVKMGLVITAIGLGIALHAYRKNKKAQAATQHAAAVTSASHHGQQHALGAAGLGMAGAAGYAASNSHTSHTTSNRSKLLDPSIIYLHLVQGILDKHLERFYPPSSDPNSLVHRLANDIAQSGKLARLADLLDLPDDLALDIVRLALYDIVLLVDDSGSMNHKSRQAEMVSYVSEIANVCSSFDTSGIEIRFMNSNDKGNNIRSESEVAQMLSRNPPNGATPMGRSLRDKILRPLVLERASRNALPKPVMIHIFTDGAATDRGKDTVPYVIQETIQELQRMGMPNSVFFSFAQVGTDSDAIDYLSSLDNEKSIGPYIDVTSNPAIETKQVLKALDGNVKNAPPQFARIKDDLKHDQQLWMTVFRLKRLLGGIHSWYDQSDESGSKSRWRLSRSDDMTYKPHWSEMPDHRRTVEAVHQQRGYVFSTPAVQAQAPAQAPAFDPYQSQQQQQPYSYDQNPTSAYGYDYNALPPQQQQSNYGFQPSQPGYGAPPMNVVSYGSNFPPASQPYVNPSYNNNNDPYGQQQTSYPAYPPVDNAGTTGYNSGYGVPPQGQGVPQQGQGYGYDYGYGQQQQQNPVGGFAFPTPGAY